MQQTLIYQSREQFVRLMCARALRFELSPQMDIERKWRINDDKMDRICANRFGRLFTKMFPPFYPTAKKLLDSSIVNKSKCVVFHAYYHFSFRTHIALLFVCVCNSHFIVIRRAASTICSFMQRVIFRMHLCTLRSKSVTITTITAIMMQWWHKALRQCNRRAVSQLSLHCSC